jgi:hypothetical protein
MNERIEKLAVQARAETYAHFDDETFDWDVWHTVFQHKFAELIVREMLQTCEDHPTWTGRMIGEQIKQHFGVEE